VNLAAATIPADDAVAGAVYELNCDGYLTGGGSAEQLNLAPSLGGTAFSSSSLASTNYSAGTRFQLTMRLVCVTAGSGGTWRASLGGTIGAGGNIVVGAGTSSGGDTAVDTTVGNVMAITGHWQGAGAAAQICKPLIGVFKRVA
jgi:hypothetical protein